MTGFPGNSREMIFNMGKQIGNILEVTVKSPAIHIGEAADIRNCNCRQIFFFQQSEQSVLDRVDRILGSAVQGFGFSHRNSPLISSSPGAAFVKKEVPFVFLDNYQVQCTEKNKCMEI